MAKWGEGDKRWLVEEREDGTNVNNWHWKETDVLPWAKNRLTELLLAPPASPLATTLVAVPSVTGDCVMNQRKGKLIPSYELQVHITWTRDGASGTIDLPYLADENAEDEPDLKVVVSTPGSHGDADALRRQVLAEVKAHVTAAAQTWATEMAAGAGIGAKGGGGVPSTATTKASTNTSTTHPNHKPSSTTKPTTTTTTTTKSHNTGKIEFEEPFICRAEDVFEALTDARRIMGFTQAPAESEPRPGGRLAMFGGAVEATYLEVTRPARVVWKWRRSEWPEDAWSRVQMDIQEASYGDVRLRLTQTEIPETDKFGNRDVIPNLEKGWRERIFGMIKRVFGYGHNMYS